MKQEKAFAGRTGMELETIKKNFRSVESEMGVQETLERNKLYQ